jgi:uncharacterized protein YecT (DUF1311 family)
MGLIRTSGGVLAVLLLAAGRAALADGAALPIEACGIGLAATIEDEANFANVGLDGAKFRRASAPKFLNVLGELCRTSPKHQALVASRVQSVVLRAAPGADDITVYLLGKTLTMEFPDADFHAAAFRKQLQTALEKGSLVKASFDCAKAASPVEKLICSDPALAEADYGVGDAYRNLLKRDTADPAKLASWRQTEKEWLAQRDHDCIAGKDPAALDPESPAAKPVIDCLTASTGARGDALRAALFGPEPTAPPARTTYADGKDNTATLDEHADGTADFSILTGSTRGVCSADETATREALDVFVFHSPDAKCKITLTRAARTLEVKTEGNCASLYCGEHADGLDHLFKRK